MTTKASDYIENLPTYDAIDLIPACDETLKQAARAWATKYNVGITRMSQAWGKMYRHAHKYRRSMTDEEILRAAVRYIVAEENAKRK